MLAYNLKDILTLVPEATDLVKQASIEEEFPTNNKDSVCASYLRVQYLTKVAHKAVSRETQELIQKAAELYGVKPQLDKLSKGLEKKAHAEKEDTLNAFLLAKDRISLDGIEKVAQLAKAVIKSEFHRCFAEDVSIYAGEAWLNKEAAVRGLANRFLATKEEGFKKLAHLVAKSLHEDDFDNIRNVCSTVTQLDKKAGLDILGFNFYKEALIPFTKEAAFKSSLGVTLCGEPVPYESIEKFGKDRIGSVLGKDVGGAMTGDPVNDKYVLEALPRDLQKLLKAQLKNV